MNLKTVAPGRLRPLKGACPEPPPEAELPSADVEGGVQAIFWLSWLVAALGLIVLAAFAAATDYFPSDLGLAHRIQDANAAPITDALDWASRLADLPLVAVVGLAAALGLWLLARPAEALWLVVALPLPLLNGIVKALVDRPRPSAALVEVSEKAGGSSFPSGHVTTAVVVYGLLFYLAALVIPQRGLRYLAQLACLALIVLTGLQRVHAGVHWPSDVLGGLLLGGLLLSLLVWSHRRLARPDLSGIAT